MREGRLNVTDLDSLESFLGEFKVKRLQDEASISSGRTIKGTVTIGRQEHAYMEPHAALVVPVGEKDEFVCYCTTQQPAKVQFNMAKVLGIPRHKIIIKNKRIGGAFGGKARLLPSLVEFYWHLNALISLKVKLSLVDTFIIKVVYQTILSSNKKKFQKAPLKYKSDPRSLIYEYIKWFTKSVSWTHSPKT